ncbi:MAG: ATPase, partial [Calditrichaeota bacterium]|nr:ATPase [Calditrichota bacterium]
MAKISFGRKDRLIKEKRHDAYHINDKLPEPTVCSECGALFTTGRWTWKDVPAGAHTTTCPACRRISQDYPAGIIELKGPFLRIHRE